MIETSVFLFAIGTLFNIDETKIFVALHTEVSIDPDAKTITIAQHDLQTFTEVVPEATKNLKQLLLMEQADSTFKGISLLFKEFYADGEKLNAVVKLNYGSLKDLEQLSFHLHEGNLYLLNAEEDGIIAPGAVEEGNYLKFNPSEKITLFFNLKKQALHTSLLPIWKSIKP